MAKKSTSETSIEKVAARRAGKGGIVPTAAPFEPGNNMSKGRPPNAGLSLREEVNRLMAADPTEAELRSLATATATGVRRRAAAIELLALLEIPDIADFQPLLEGKKTFVELRDAGINTRLIKRFKKGEHGPELELHDRASSRFVQVVEQTDGQATKRVAQVSDGAGVMTPEKLVRMAEVILACGGTVDRLPAMMREAYRRAKGLIA
jgi:hypothetical protein